MQGRERSATVVSPRLLVSVRSLCEAWDACQGGVDILDLKEPNFGPLGRVSPCVASEVSQGLGDSAPLSLAMGELADWSPRTNAAYPLGAFRFAKVGLAGLRGQRWQSAWRNWQVSLPTICQAVLVSYVDEGLADAPALEEILDFAEEAMVRVVLLDTCCKSGPSLTEILSPEMIRQCIQRRRNRRLQLAVAGRLTLASIRVLLPLRPDIIAVRSAVCLGDRTHSVSRSRVQSLRQFMDSNRRPSLAPGAAEEFQDSSEAIG